MSWLSTLTPINLLEEKSKFIADQSYNPQFIYEDEIPQEQLLEYGLPSEPYISLAQEILDKTYHNRNYLDLVHMEGKVIDHDEVEKRIRTFLEMHGLKKRYEIIWSSTFVSRATIDGSTIRLRTNSEFRQENLIGMIYHEIGTHAIRRENYEKQPWFKKRKKFGLIHQYLPTEEGLASLHVLLPKSFTLMYTSAMRYLTNNYAQTHSFAETWQFLSKYMQNDFETQWMICFRQKRGIKDTSQGGGYTKDLVYFEGAVKVWKWLAKNNFDPTALYYGKISHEDAELAVELSPGFEPLLPSFYTLDQKSYRKKIEEIGTTNQFDKVIIANGS